MRDIKSVFVNISEAALPLFNSRLKRFTLAQCDSWAEFEIITNRSGNVIIVLDGYNYENVLVKRFSQKFATVVISDFPTPLSEIAGIVDPNFRPTPLLKSKNYFYGVGQIPFNYRMNKYKISAQESKSPGEPQGLILAIATSVSADPEGFLEREIILSIAKNIVTVRRIFVFKPRFMYCHALRNLGINTQVYPIYNIDKFFKSISSADISVLTMGRMMYESLFIGTPVIAIPVSKGHLDYKKQIEKSGAIIVANLKNLEVTLSRFIQKSESASKIQKMRERCSSIFRADQKEREFLDFFVKFMKNKQ